MNQSFLSVSMVQSVHVSQCIIETNLQTHSSLATCTFISHSLSCFFHGGSLLNQPCIPTQHATQPQLHTDNHNLHNPVPNTQPKKAPFHNPSHVWPNTPLPHHPLLCPMHPFTAVLTPHYSPLHDILPPEPLLNPVMQCFPASMMQFRTPSHDEHKVHSFVCLWLLLCLHPGFISLDSSSVDLLFPLHFLLGSLLLFLLLLLTLLLLLVLVRETPATKQTASLEISNFLIFPSFGSCWIQSALVVIVPLTKLQRSWDKCGIFRNFRKHTGGTCHQTPECYSM